MRKSLIGVIIFFNLLFVSYLFWPSGMTKVYDLPPLPNSTPSKLSGDTVQIPNLTAYFSNHYRQFVTRFYKQELQKAYRLPFGPVVFNHPPEEAFVFIKDQTHSTYLEEYFYPFKGALFVNGLEPFEEKTKTPRYSASSLFGQDGVNHETKVTIRYYPIVWRKKILVVFLFNTVLVVFFKLWQNLKRLLLS